MGTVYGLVTENAMVERVSLLAALFVGILFLAGQFISVVASFFWILNTFNGWVQPIMFRALDVVLKTAEAGNPTSVVNKIDEFCWGGDKMMNVGNVKGAIVDAEIKKLQPKLMMELGAHMGYSTVRFASLLPEGGVLHSVEPEPMGHATGMALLRFAGIPDRVVPEYDFSDAVLKRFGREARKIDLLFIDHVKGLYLPDLQLALSLGVLRPGSVVIADNVLVPGAPEYKAWILGPGKQWFDTTIHKTFVEYSRVPDEVLVSVYKGE